MKIFNISRYGKEWEKTKELNIQDIEDNKKAVLDYLEENYCPLNDDEKENLEIWFNEESTIQIFENEQEQRDEIKNLLIEQEQLEYVTTNCLVDNLKDELKDLEYDNDTMIELIDTIKEKGIRGNSNFIAKFIDVEGVIDDILRLDGIGHMVNYYDGKEIEIKNKTTNEWHILTLA